MADPRAGQPGAGQRLPTPDLRPASPAARPVHGRMPAILPPEPYAAWVDRGLGEPAQLPRLLPYPAGDMTATPLGPAVNDPRNDGPECLAPSAQQA